MPATSIWDSRDIQVQKWFLSHEPVENDTCTYSQLVQTTIVTAAGDGVQGMVQVHPAQGAWSSHMLPIFPVLTGRNLVPLDQGVMYF